MRHSFSLHRAIGAPEPRRRFTLSGRQFFQHRLSGVRELRQRVRPVRAAPFSAPADRGTRTASAGSPLTGGEFSAEPQRGIAPSADGGSVPRPAAGAKRKDNLRFSFLFELLPFPCFLIWRRLPTCDRFEIGVRQRIFSSVSFATCSQCQIPYCYTCGLLYAGRGITVPRNSLARYDRQHLRI